MNHIELVKQLRPDGRMGDVNPRRDRRGRGFTEQMKRQARYHVELSE